MPGWLAATSALRTAMRQQEEGAPPRLYLQLGTGMGIGHSVGNKLCEEARTERRFHSNADLEIPAHSWKHSEAKFI